MIITETVSVVIPAYNEETIIEKTLDTLVFDWIKEIIIINDGSRDNTLRYICEFKSKTTFPVKIINQKKNIGKGKAVELGLKQAGGEIIALIDADLGKSVKEVERLVLPVLKGTAEVTIGVLPIKSGGIGLVRKLADKGLNFITGKKLKAPLSGQRVFKKKILNDSLPLSDNFGLEIGMDIDILRNGYKVMEISCDMTHKITGNDWKGYCHRGHQFISILRTLWQKKVRI